jgi:hypothetical protein
MPEEAAEREVFMPTSGMIREFLPTAPKVDPQLNPYQANQRIRDPKTQNV